MSSNFAMRCGWLSRVVISVGLLARAAYAEPTPATTLPNVKDPLRPWAIGVTKDHQGRALALFKTGNAFFADGEYLDAITEYRKAVTQWQHPAIEFNLAVSLIKVDQLSEAWDELERALRYDDAPLGADLYKDGLQYRQTLRARLITVNVDARDAGFTVAFDGRSIGTTPLTKIIHALPGEHQVAATAPHKAAIVKSFVTDAGHRTDVTIERDENSAEDGAAARVSVVAPVAPPSLGIVRAPVAISAPTLAVTATPVRTHWYADAVGGALGASGIVCAVVGAGLLGHAGVVVSHENTAAGYADARNINPTTAAGITFASVGGALMIASAIRYAVIAHRIMGGGR